MGIICLFWISLTRLQNPDPGPWTKSIPPILVELLQAEQLYCSLSYLDTTWLQKDVHSCCYRCCIVFMVAQALRKQYQDVNMGILRVLQGGVVSKVAASESGTDSSTWVAELFNQVILFSQMRMDLIAMHVFCFL